MPAIDIRRRLDADDVAAISALLDDAWRADGARPFNDHLWIDLRGGGGDGFAGIIARDDDHDRPLAYCQVSRANGAWLLDLVVHPHHRYDTLEIGPALLGAALEVVAGDGGGRVSWWVFEPGNLHARLAGEHGLVPGRRLLQMRRPLPLEDALRAEIADLALSPFRPGVDDEEWLAVNNLAFASHPEQGGWTRDTLASRRSEAWFDPAGFLLHRDDGGLAGFCWTKVHTETTPPLGEIYAIAVHPSRAGRGLGRRLTIAGLVHLADRGMTEAMLYVDADNSRAVAMYEGMGFRLHHHETAYVGEVAPR